MKLEVYYDGRINSELDEVLEEALSRIGFVRWSSGYDLMNDARDLVFEYKQTDSDVRLEATAPDGELPEVAVRCETLFYIGLGEERECGDEAVALIDAGTPNESPVCAECARRCHPSRLTPIEK